MLDSLHLSRILGLSFIIIGTLALLAAALAHRQDLNNIERGSFTDKSRLSLSFIVAIALITVGIIAFLGILMTRG